MHPTYAVTQEREPKDAVGTRGGLLESSRWTEGYSRIAELAARLPDTRLV